MSFSTRAKTNAAFGLALLILGVVALISYLRTTTLVGATNAAGQTQLVLRRIETMHTLVTEAETGQRGYLLTGEDRYLTPYTAAVQGYSQEEAQLTPLIAGEPQQQQALQQLHSLVAQKFAELEQTIQLRRQGGLDAALPVVLSDRGQTLMDQVRATIASMEQRETERLRSGEAAATATTERARIAMAAGALLAVLLSAMALVAINRDISRRQRAEANLQEALARLEQQYREVEHAQLTGRAVLDATGEAIALLSPEQRFLSVNRRFTELFGMAPDELLGKPAAVLRPEIERAFDDPARFQTQAPGAGDGSERQYTAIVQQRWPDQRELALFSTPVRTQEGRSLGRLFAFRDVTQEREVDRMKSEFVSLVSHELRTPLTSIKGYIDLLLEGEAGELKAEQAEFLEIVRKNTSRLLALINDLLDVSRIEAGRVELQSEVLDLDRLIRGVAASLRPQIEAKGQTLRLDLDQALPPAWGDSTRVLQVLTNLLANANKYTPEGGHIAISATRESVGHRVSGIGNGPQLQTASTRSPVSRPLAETEGQQARREDRQTSAASWQENEAQPPLHAGRYPLPAGDRRPAMLRVDVIDDGIGLSPDEQAQVFGKFFRARNTTTREEGGTGLGLAIVRSLVELHGGEITVSGAPGRGSTFSFTLPVAPPPVQLSSSSGGHQFEAEAP